MDKWMFTRHPAKKLMISYLKKYAKWLHTGFPAGLVEPLPEVREDGTTNVSGLYVVGDLTGVPLLKFSADSGARAVRHILSDSQFKKGEGDVLDLAIVGAGVSGVAAALEAKSAGLTFQLFEAKAPFATIRDFPRNKPIYTYPKEMTPQGDLDFPESLDVKEKLLEALEKRLDEAGIVPKTQRVEQVASRGGHLEVRLGDGGVVKARRVIVGIGRSGNYRKLNVEGESLDKVTNRLHDPTDFNGKDVLVVGGGDSALEAAAALAGAGARVSLSYRKKEFTRPKPENVKQILALANENAPGSGTLTLHLETAIEEIAENTVRIKGAKGDITLDNDAVFTLIGREPPLDFFERSGVSVMGQFTVWKWISLILFFGLCFWVYHWKKHYGWAFGDAVDPSILWNRLAETPTALGAAAADPSTLLGTLKISMSSPGFYYTLVYSIVIVVFGVRRIQRKRTPYIKWQTLTLMAVQCLPLFILPEIILPLLGHNGVISESSWLANELFPIANYGHGREYWRAYGFILAWPLFFSNLFTGAPLTLWLVISLAQTFVVIPLIVRKWGKGAYCGWICSCGAMAETLGDAHRHKMPHGPFWNRLNMVGQVFLAVVMLLLVLRVLSWVAPSSLGKDTYQLIFTGKANYSSWPAAVRWLEYPLAIFNYAWFVDLLFAGILGLGLYFHFSGRVWCRFACPLAALMHIYARFTRFRILADKKKCISCNQCTVICHQGIDVMGFANKGRPMKDPECVRCSSCVYVCPTGTLTFGEVHPKTGAVLRTNNLAASPVQAAESIDVK